jgi:hypothetical protein
MASKLKFRGSYYTDLVNGIIPIPSGILSRGTYEILHKQDEGYRSLGLRKMPLLRIVKGFLTRESDNIATWINDTFPIPKESSRFLGIAQNDKVLLLPSLDYALRIWEIGEFLRYNSTISESELLQFMAELDIDPLSQHYNNPPAQPDRHFPGF